MNILNLKLENFRGIKNLSINFTNNTDIYGANGVGKTTVANAICYLLIDRPATEEKDFNPKTIGLREAHHIAEMKIKTDSGAEMTLKKDFYEKYTKKKGAAVAEYTGNVIDYYIDGVKSKQKDYNATVERVLGVTTDKAKMLLVLSYFAETMKTDEKRKILFELAEEFSDEDIFKANKNLLGLKKYLLKPGASDDYYTNEQWKSIASEERKHLNKNLELLPARIDELQKTLPENSFDEEGLKVKLSELEKGKESLEREKQAAISESGKESAFAKLKAKIEERRAEFIKANSAKSEKANNEINELSFELSHISANIRKIDYEKEQIEDKIKRMENKRENLVKDYTQIKSKVWDDTKEICPTCKQKLPADKVEELKAEFNRKRSEKLERINKEGNEQCSSKMINDAKSKLEEVKTEWKELNVKHIEVYKKRETLQNSLKELPAFEDTEEFKELQNELETLQNSDEVDTKDVDEKLLNTKEEIAKINTDLASINATKQNKARIEELEKELKSTAERMEYIEKGIYLCEEFTRQKAKMVTQSINKHFKNTRFILFREQINGGLKEVCEPTGQNSFGEWVEYRSLNYASKINTQIDIVNALSEHYGANLPIILDQGESVTEPLKAGNQFIRLIVSADDKELRIEGR